MPSDLSTTQRYADIVDIVASDCWAAIALFDDMGKPEKGVL